MQDVHAAAMVKIVFTVLIAFAALSAPRSAQAAGLPPEQSYMLHCRGCHGPEGRGIPDKGVPDLYGTMGRLIAADGGRSYLVRVPGTAQAPIDDTEVASLLNWMLTEFSAHTLPPNLSPYTAEEVGRYRREPLENPGAMRRKLLDIRE